MNKNSFINQLKLDQQEAPLKTNPSLYKMLKYLNLKKPIALPYTKFIFDALLSSFPDSLGF